MQADVVDFDAFAVLQRKRDRRKVAQHHGALFLGGRLVAVGQAEFMVLHEALFVVAPQALLDGSGGLDVVGPRGLRRGRDDGAVGALGHVVVDVAHAFEQRRMAVVGMRHVGGLHRLDEGVRAGIRRESGGHEAGNAQCAVVLAVLRKELPLDVVAVAGVGRNLDQRLHDGAGCREARRHTVGLVFALAAVACQGELEDHAVEAQQVVRHDGQAAAAHLPSVLVELPQFGAERSAVAGVAAAQVGQFVREHRIGFGLVEHTQQRNAHEQRAALQRASTDLAGRLGDEEVGVDAGDDLVGRRSVHAAGELADAVPQAGCIGLGDQFAFDLVARRQLLEQRVDRIEHGRRGRNTAMAISLM